MTQTTVLSTMRAATVMSGRCQAKTVFTSFFFRW